MIKKILLTLAIVLATVFASAMPAGAVYSGAVAYNRCDSSRGLLIGQSWEIDGTKAIGLCKRSTDYGIDDFGAMYLKNDQCWRMKEVSGIDSPWSSIQGGPRTFYVYDDEVWQVEVESKHGSTSSGSCWSSDFSD